MTMDDINKIVAVVEQAKKLEDGHSYLLVADVNMVSMHSLRTLGIELLDRHGIVLHIVATETNPSKCVAFLDIK